MNEATPKPVIFLAFANSRESYLHNLQLEQRRIREALEIAQEKGLCLLVERANTTIGDIVSVFQNYPNRIAIFHYGGHADDNLLQLETETGSLSNASSKGLVPFLAEQKGLQLIFINGCSSKQQAEALKTAGNSAVVGTARPIDDAVATDLSKWFYQGLAAGQSIAIAWEKAENAVKMKKGDENYRAVSWKGKEESIVSGFPWEIYYPTDKEHVKGWNLPDAAGDPLFGLPEIPPTNWPEKPLRHLERYERPHARVFFGRSTYIRDLYTRIKDPKSDPIILLHGQSGVGKSSLLDAGLNPRLEEEHTVIYLRRDQEKGLTGTLAFALEQKLAELRATSAALKSLPGTAATEQDPRWQAILQLQAAAQSLDEQSVRQEIEALITRLHPSSDVAPATAQTPPGNDAPGNDVNDARGRLPDRWRELERLTGKPLVATLDQVEELYTRPHLQGPKAELEDFLSALQSLFGTPASRPRGRLLLGCRTGYPNIEEALEKAGLPRATMMLGGFRKEDILDIFRGLTSPNLFRRYQLSVEDELPAMIADDLVEDKDSPMAPVLQILLSNMWETAKRENSGVRGFTVEQYLKLKKDGTPFSEFFAQQMARLRAWQPEVVDSGLALDILHFHVPAKETTGACSLDELRKRYEHRREIFGDLIAKLRELYLLTDAPDRTEYIGLIHDCLAPVVAKKYLNSTLPGQVARRILENKLTDSKKETLGETDIKLVMAGRAGTKQLAPEEEDLLKRSDRQIKFKWRAWRVGTATFVLFLFAVLAYVGQKREKAEKAIADASLAVGFMSRIHAKLDTVPGARDVQLELVDKTDDLKSRLGMSPAGGVSEPPATTFWKKLQDGDNEWRRANVDSARALYNEARLIACGEAISGNSGWWRRLLSTLSLGSAAARGNACSEAESGDSAWRRNLMVSYQSLGELEKDAGNLKIALDHFEKARQIAERMAREKSEDRQAQRDLAIAWSDLGGLQSDDDQRLESYDKARQIAGQLADADPKNP
jgi:hypothetical protein